MASVVLFKTGRDDNTGAEVKISANFDVCEIVPKELYEKYGDLAVRYINMKLVVIVEIIREFYKSRVTVNDYYYGGNHDGRGLRLHTDSAYRFGSDHNDNMAIDFVVDGVDSLKVQYDVINNVELNQKLIDEGVTGMENGTQGWTHLGISNFTLWGGIPEKNGLKLIPVPKS